MQIVNRSTSSNTNTIASSTGNSMRNSMGNTTTSVTPSQIPPSNTKLESTVSSTPPQSIHSLPSLGTQLQGTLTVPAVTAMSKTWSSTQSPQSFGDEKQSDERSKNELMVNGHSELESVTKLQPKANDEWQEEENLFLEIDAVIHYNHKMDRTPDLLFRDCEHLNFTEIQRVPDQQHLVDFPVIYQGANLHSRMFCLMTPHHVAALNALYTESMVDRTLICPQRTMSTALQDFACRLKTEKVNHGWVLGTAPNALKLPFNALVRCRLDLLKNEVVDIGRIMVSGTIGHVNDHGLAWVMSDVQMKAMEESNGSNMVSNIISLEMCNVVNTSIQNRRDCSYMIHDPLDMDTEWKKGERVRFGLKISTRSNLKDRRGIKSCFIQAWSARFMS